MCRYLKYEIYNIEPLRIADDSSSQHGQTKTLRYIPGSTIRGYVINKIKRVFGETTFERIKRELFSDDIQFLNAYVNIGKQICIPSPKGFYEDKKISNDVKEIQNVIINGVFDEGLKRATLGSMSYFEQDVIRYYSVKTGSDLKIKINDGKKDVFRNEYILPGYHFIGFIRLGATSDEIVDSIRSCFNGNIRLGNARSSGLGTCRVDNCEIIGTIPYIDYQKAEVIKDDCYLYLLSDTCMRSDIGEYVGINLSELERILDITELSIKYAATTKRMIMGYNRSLGRKLASLPVYEKGSVFHLEFSGVITEDKANLMADFGLGVRKNEGFGRAIILSNYSELTKKRPVIEGNEKKLNICAQIYDENTLNIVARQYLQNRIDSKIKSFILNHADELDGASSSQIGKIDALCTQYKYQPDEARKAFARLFTHDNDKSNRQNIHKQKAKRGNIEEFVNGIMDNNLLETLEISSDTVMTVPIEDIFTTRELEELKLSLLSTAIRFKNKKEVG